VHEFLMIHAVQPTRIQPREKVISNLY
jgi:hypothetical protein